MHFFHQSNYENVFQLDQDAQIVVSGKILLRLLLF